MHHITPSLRSRSTPIGAPSRGWPSPAGRTSPPPGGQDQAAAEVIRFPLERARPAQSGARGTGVEDASTDDTPETGTGALWAAWLTSVLSSPSAGVAGSER